MSVRSEWLKDLLTICSPVYESLAKGELKKNMPLDFHPDRAEFAPLEAFGRSIMGLAPWLEADQKCLDADEAALQKEWRQKALLCIDRATDPTSPDFMLFDRGGQPLVDAAFLAHALVRAPRELAGKLDPRVKMHLADAFRSSRAIVAVNCNWLFFTAMVEAGLYVLGEKYDLMRVLNAVRSFREWYVGDGLYGDGRVFHFDYYNSFVIHPMYTDIVNLMSGEHPEIAEMRESVNARAARYASILERLIGPEGSYPVVGRSICYRFGAFQMLAQAALEHRLEAHLTPAGVRCGLNAVIRRVMSAKDLFDACGWLQPGVYGLQPELAEGYINIGSLYLCSTVFLPLGLTPEDPFWADSDEEWTGKKVWRGGHIESDHAINL